jgi:hypothetical protein
MNRFAAALLTAVLVAPALAFPGAGGPAAGAQRVIKGTVQETLPAGTYTYLLIKTSAGEEWAAVQKTELKKGASVEVMESTVMEDFASPILKRTFKKVVFGVIAPKGGAASAAALPPGHGSGAMPPALPAAKAPRPKGEPTAVTVADAHKRGKELTGKLVAVTGKVVKANANILGKNWFHIQDGSGAAKDGSNDLTVTTAGTAAMGASVRAVGVLTAGKDLGSGYSYDVIIEDADLSAAK